MAEDYIGLIMSTSQPGSQLEKQGPHFRIKNLTDKELLIAHLSLRTDNYMTSYIISNLCFPPVFLNVFLNPRLCLDSLVDVPPAPQPKRLFNSVYFITIFYDSLNNFTQVLDDI